MIIDDSTDETGGNSDNTNNPVNTDNSNASSGGTTPPPNTDNSNASSGGTTPPSNNDNSVPPSPVRIITGGSDNGSSGNETAEPSRVLYLNIAGLTPAQMKQAIIDNIRLTPSGGVLRIVSDMMSCFDRQILEAFDEKGDIDIELFFPESNAADSRQMRAFIPRGVDIEVLLDEKGYCGFLRLASILN
ncbi:hypothetical protein [Butyrivibrio sp. AE2032]|uniref:hypothetical protein n=1 Tax=Butyrivibrio sp. AE2032 TaxID=1458463 RepID=UPI000551322A|nr:hypothetical protein [Butyrivibrio sp. AE2032]